MKKRQPREGDSQRPNRGERALDTNGEGASPGLREDEINKRANQCGLQRQEINQALREVAPFKLDRAVAGALLKRRGEADGQGPVAASQLRG